jgi:hypothetical protein
MGTKLHHDLAYLAPLSRLWREYKSNFNYIYCNKTIAMLLKLQSRKFHPSLFYFFLFYCKRTNTVLLSKPWEAHWDQRSQWAPYMIMVFTSSEKHLRFRSKPGFIYRSRFRRQSLYNYSSMASSFRLARPRAYISLEF